MFLPNFIHVDTKADIATDPNYVRSREPDLHTGPRTNWFKVLAQQPYTYNQQHCRGRHTP